MSVLENKFLKSLNRISHFVIPETSSDMEHLATIFEALEKQIPQKPVEYNTGYPAMYKLPWDDSWGYECPYCGNRDIDFPDHHCKCGQALDWSDEK